ncbi:MAG: hypothetical protein HY703_00750 [Gemmatimonadetes bacterium]|nr:hypothetical protein [Gemmatimonadota bacterium]
MNPLLLLTAQAAETAAAAAGLSAGALAFMLLSIGMVTALTLYCFWRVLQRKEHIDPDGTGPAEPPIAGAVEERGR